MQTKPKFQIGDRVVNLPTLTTPGLYPEWFVGLHGTVCHVFTDRGVDADGELYGIDYDRDLEGMGHTCDGHARSGHGRNIRGAFLKLEEDPILIDPSALL